MISRHANASLISSFIVFLLPLLMAAYWPLAGTGHAVHAAVIAVRVGVLGGVAILYLLWIGARSSPLELKWAAIVAGWLCVTLVTSLIGDNFARGLHHWVRILPVYCTGVLLARPLRHKATSQALGIGLQIASLVSLLFIVVLYVNHMGLSPPSYERIRVLKRIVQHAGVALNPLATATLLFSALSLCLTCSGWLQSSITASVAILASVLSGSRAPVALALVGASALLITTLLRGRTIALRILACTGISLCLMAGGIAGSFFFTPERLSAATEGRYDLWAVGMEKFLERPVTGYGPESWRDDLVSRLPGYYRRLSVTTLRAGGYHSEFITLLAEGGLLCFVSAMIIFVLLFQACCRIAFHASVRGFDGKAVLFTFYLFFFRAAVEVPGMFGYGEDVADYLSAIFIAIVLSKASLLPQQGVLQPDYSVARYTSSQLVETTA